MVRRVLVAVVAAGALTFSVFLVRGGGSVAEQTALLADAGIAAANRVATCPVRIEQECLAAMRAAGMPVRRYDRVRFPVALTVLADAGREVQLPPMAPAARDCIEVVDWADCGLDPPATFPAVAALWGQALPFSVAGVTRRCVRREVDAGLLCRRQPPDGGAPFNFGDRNVFPRSEAANPTQCAPVECVVYLGDDPEVDL